MTTRSPKPCPLCHRKPKVFRPLYGGWTVRCSPKKWRQVTHDLTTWSVRKAWALDRWNALAQEPAP